MTEEFLHYIWKYKLFNQTDLTADTGEKISIIKTGEHNRDAGPDFFNAVLKIGETTWAGNVEVHLNSSDWYKHNHHCDKAYNNVILQVVEKNDRLVLRENGQKVPTLKIIYDQKLFDNYRSLLDTKKWVSCQDKLEKIDRFLVNYWLETVMIERLQEKSDILKRTLIQLKNDWSETFYIHLARNFGFKVNSDPFEMLARSLPLKIIAKHKDNLFQVEALLYGQAGFFEKKINDTYHQSLSKEYHFLKEKYKLKALENHLWKYLRLRPDNFPTIRLAQFAALINQSAFLFSKIIETKNIVQLIRFFDVETSEYWKDHYRFGKNKIKTRPGRIGKESIHNILINTVSPFLFLYGKLNAIDEIRERALSVLTGISPESNSILKKWKIAGLIPGNALQGQSLLQLKKNYCDKKNCLNCMFGNKIITSTN